MCGIVGFHELGERVVLWEEEKIAFVNMLDLQKHRGPDDRGITGYCFQEEYSIEFDKSECFEGNLNGLIGFNRLSIRDLSINGHQPMRSQDGKVIIAFNGEIYNADEWREKLKKSGYKFRGMSDTEVILNLYMEYGLEESVKLLNGMFAIVLIDLQKRQMYLIRDRFGIKPLYYCILNNRIYYSSEYKSFLAIDDFKAELDMGALYEYMVFISSIDRNLLKGVEQVHPGEIMIIDGNIIKNIQYFNIDSYERPIELSDFHEKKEILEDVLRNAVSRQMVSDVKLGCQLSGGVDSSLISYFAAENKRSPMKDSVSITFSDAAMNEEKWIAEAAQKIDIQTHKYMFDTDFLLRNLENVIWHLEGILTVPNAAALLMLTMNAKKEVTVLLSGEGADETFAGYSNHNSVFLRYFYKHNAEIRSIFTNKKWLCKKLLGEFEGDEMLAAVMEMCYVMPDNVTNMLNMYSDNGMIEKRLQKIKSYKGNMLEKYIKYEMQTYLPELLIRQDKMSMANSIENRVPFLDNEVVDASFNIPVDYMLCVNKRLYDRQKGNGGIEYVVGKYILKEICAEKYGEEFAYRGKCGFGLPLKYFMGTKEFRKRYHEELESGIIHRGVINSSYVKWLYDRLPILDWREVELLWRAINVEIYAQLYIDGKGMQRIA